MKFAFLTFLIIWGNLAFASGAHLLDWLRQLRNMETSDQPQIDERDIIFSRGVNPVALPIVKRTFFLTESEIPIALSQRRCLSNQETIVLFNPEAHSNDDDFPDPDLFLLDATTANSSTGTMQTCEIKIEPIKDAMELLKTSPN